MSPDDDSTSVHNRVLLGSVSLKDLKVKERRAVARRLLQRADTDKRARGVLLEMLQGPIPQARPIGRMIAASKKRAILLEAWAASCRQSSKDFLEDRHSFSREEVAARADWMTRQLSKMRAIPEDAAKDLAEAVCELGIQTLAQPAGEPAGKTLARTVVVLNRWCTQVPDIALRTALAAAGPFRPRVSFVREIDSESEGAFDLMKQLRADALKRDAELAGFTFSTIADRDERGRQLGAYIRSGVDSEIAAAVLRQFLEDTNIEYRTAYLDPLLSLGLVTGDLPEDLVQSVVGMVRTELSLTERGLAGVLGRVVSVIDAGHRAKIGELEAAHREALEQAGARADELSREIVRLNEAIESVKRTTKEPEQQTEHRTRAASLTPVCLIHQEILLSLRERPDLRLQSFAKTLDGALVRQGVTRLGKEAETAAFDPSHHEFARWANQQGDDVRVVVPGYLLRHPILGTETVLARAIVEGEADAAGS
jgi:hypothetical protein